MLAHHELQDLGITSFKIRRKPLPSTRNELDNPSQVSEHWQQSSEECGGSTSHPLLDDSGDPDRDQKNGSYNSAQEIGDQSSTLGQSRKQRKCNTLFSTLKPPAGQATLLFCIVLAFSVFLINLIATLWAVSHTGVGNGLVGLYSGQCDKVRNVSIWLHLLLNILATLLLGASNHVMQRLCAPSRLDVDIRHRAHRHATIGSMEVRNLGGRRLWLYLLLATSSLPIHLLYNSVSVATDKIAQWSSYQVLIPEARISTVLAEDSIPPPPVRTADGYLGAWGNLVFRDDADYVVKWIYNDRPVLQKLSVSDCISAYATTKNRFHGDALIVSAGNKINFTDGFSVFTYNAYILSSPEAFLFDPNVSQEIANQAQYGTTGPFDWMCYHESVKYDEPILCSAENVAKDGHWMYGSNRVLYCLSRVMQPTCELDFSFPIAFTVLACTFSKLAAMILALYLRRENVLTTLGDAIASFLHHQDLHEACDRPSHRSCCQFRDRLDVRQPTERGSRDEWLLSWVPYAYTSAIISNLINLVALSFCLYYISDTIIGIKYFVTNIYSPTVPFKSALFWGTGIGSSPFYTKSVGDTSGGAFLDLAQPLPGDPFPSGDPFLSGVLIANIPQLVFSAVYLFNNAMFTNFFRVREWNSYGKRRQGLRVTAPQAGTAQRTAYFLSFPLKWSLPFLAFMTLTHWFVSQTIFLERTNATYPGGLAVVLQIGVSPIGLICTCVAILVLSLFGLVLLFWKIRWYAPPTCGDSVVISAACHPLLPDDDAHLKAVQFGVMPIDGDDMVFHCSFSSRRVDCIRIGRRKHGESHWWVGKVERPPPEALLPLPAGQHEDPDIPFEQVD